MADKIVVPSQLGRGKGANFGPLFTKRTMEELEEHSASAAMTRARRLTLHALARSGSELEQMSKDEPKAYTEAQQLAREFCEHAESLFKAARAAVQRMRSAEYERRDPRRVINETERNDIARNIFRWLSDQKTSVRLGFARLLVRKLHERYDVHSVRCIRRKDLRSAQCMTARWSDDVWRAIQYGEFRGVVTEEAYAKIYECPRVEIVRGHLRLVRSRG